MFSPIDGFLLFTVLKIEVKSIVMYLQVQVTGLHTEENIYTQNADFKWFDVNSSSNFFAWVQRKTLNLNEMYWIGMHPIYTKHIFPND